ncbi:hypothetical protein [Agromyces binzhouensis]|uniref:Uncharacterized protein n=1 Tax=Agromyces binzhouensis TaxID=1817495 RepID=A0A4Q2JWF0_9MICO|nr:hypothetical protein [Agromyces binzhouensis]RXZ51734.1 hypothetical protein ESO86_01105 [Agromyces binzhouensis]
MGFVLMELASESPDLTGYAVLATLAGVVVTSVFSVIAVFVGSSLQRSHTQARDREERFSSLLSSSHALVLGLGRVAHAPNRLKRTEFETLFGLHGDSFNRDLASIRLRDSEELVDAVKQFDSALIALTRIAMSRKWATEEWRIARSATLDPHLDRVISEFRSTR